MKSILIFLAIITGSATRLVSETFDWQLLSLPFYEIYFSIYKGPSGKLYTSTSNGNQAGGFYMSQNEGQSWTKLSTSGMYMTRIYTNDEVNWLASDYMLSSGHYFLYVSRDGGSSWFNVPIQSEFAALAKNNYIVAIERDEKQLHLSKDFGVSWPLIEEIAGVRFSHIETAKDGRIWASSESNGIYYSDDNGQSWLRLNPDPPVVDNIVMLAISESGLPFIMSGNGNIYFLDQSKTAWKALLSPLITASNVEDIFIIRDKYIFILNADHDYYMSCDGGLSWDHPGDDSHVRTVYNFYCQGNTIYAGTHTGVWQATITPSTVDEAPDASLVEVNTEAGRVIIRAAAGSSAGLYDLTGRMTRELVMDSGEKSMSIDGLRGGVYFLTIDNGNKRVVRKILIQQ